MNIDQNALGLIAVVTGDFDYTCYCYSQRSICAEYRASCCRNMWL